jgi:hypothetical protein
VHKTRLTIGLGVSARAALAAAACSSSSSPASSIDAGNDATTTTPEDSGTTTPEDSGTVTPADAGAPDTGTVAPQDAAAEADAGSTLYSRLGGHAGIRAAINAIVAQELMDPDIKTYFFNQVAVPVPAGHPTADQIEECFTDLLANIAGGPEVYPQTVVTLDDAGNDAGSFLCRDMVTIHQPLKISGGTFDSFVMIAGGVLTSAMGTGPYTYTTDDITTIGGALVGTKSSIVDTNLADAGAQVYPGPDAQ